uniref:TetR family transcriptional regulator n=1 Tax=Aliarcobacter sp. TaxID=2321116 RepID=UPI004048B23B
MTTKDKIIEVSIKLFNEKGCLNTSTRHIADELNISVGNLYYHFKNKEEILTAIFLQYLEIVFKEVSSLDYSQDEIFLLKNFLLDNLEADIKYRFLHLELNLLVMTFPSFKKIMEEQLQNEIEMIKKLVNYQIKYGYIIEMQDEEIDLFVSNSWIIACNNLSFWNLLSNDLIDNAKKGALNMFYFIKPYLTKKSLENEQIKTILNVLKNDKEKI